MDHQDENVICWGEIVMFILSERNYYLTEEEIVRECADLLAKCVNEVLDKVREAVSTGIQLGYIKMKNLDMNPCCSKDALMPSYTIMDFDEKNIQFKLYENEEIGSDELDSDIFECSSSGSLE
ncbi:uncharacterized protein LOC119662472 [Teleopsis dalmanni]|uniref:uncharacterized protein LOC119662472 n=1 Tax=Teleopsis dalmanni TaxID=139649 RepID=UPI000D32B87D|nr:uncharacterized protein LOC119662472 [Teleopsis dalmanni]